MVKRIETPSNLEINHEAFAYAKELIAQGKVNCQERNWSENKPTPEAEDVYLLDHTFDEYSKWFLATKEEASGNTKEHYEFPIGNFDEIFRSGVIAARARAAQFKHHEIEEAAAELLDLIDNAVCKA
jgi:hypothetical protein